MSYTILMNANKFLVCTNKINIYRGENLVDKLKFLVPYQWSEDIDLREFTCAMIYEDQKFTAHTEILSLDEELYKEDFAQYTLPVDSKITMFSGDIELFLQFQKNDEDNGKIYVLKTYPITITVDSVHDYYSSIDTTSLEFVTATISELDAKIAEIKTLAEIFEETKADNIGITDDGSVQLQADGEWIGDKINVAIPEAEDDDDDIADGVIDLNKKYETINL